MNKLLVLITCLFVSVSSAISAPLFKNWKKYPVDDGPRSVIPTDLDSDGDIDLAVGYNGNNWDPDTVISVLKNNGDGTFAARIDYRTGLVPMEVSSADFDNDGDIDLAVVNQGDYLNPGSTVSVLTNSGNAIFSSKADYSAGVRPISIFCSDLDGDGYADLAVANFESGTVSVLKNKGDGTFGTKVDYDLGAWPASVSGSDLDLDGDIDLVIVSNQGCDGKLIVLENNGDGTLAAPVDYPMEGISLFASDLDDDGFSDLAIVNSWGNPCYSGDSVFIFKNNRDGSFTRASGYGYLQDPFSITGSDLDGDGDIDLAATSYGICDNFDHCLEGDYISVFLNNGDGTFIPDTNYPTGYNPASICAADFDGDEDADLAVANHQSNQIQIFLNTSNPAKGDVDGDGTFAFADLVSLLNCVFFGTGDCNRYSSDVNCDGGLTSADMVLEINKFFLGTPFPC